MSYKKVLQPLTSDQAALVRKTMDRLKHESINTTGTLSGVLKETREDGFQGKTHNFLRSLQNIVEIWVRIPNKNIDDVVRDWADYWCTKAVST